MEKDIAHAEKEDLLGVSLTFAGENGWARLFREIVDSIPFYKTYNAIRGPRQSTNTSEYNADTPFHDKQNIPLVFVPVGFPVRYKSNRHYSSLCFLKGNFLLILPFQFMIGIKKTKEIIER
jgi:hypothetical protein